MQNRDGTILEVYVGHLEGQDFRHPASHAEQEPDEQSVSPARSGLLHEIYFG
jgi:hypothetical protein